MIPASSLTLGINVHPSQDPTKVIAAMKATGFTRYRCDTAVPLFLNTLAAAGMTACLIVSDGPQATGGQLDLIRSLVQAYPGSVDFIEGRNEVNNHQTVYGGFKDTTGGDQSNRSAIHLYMRDLVATVEADPVLSHIHVLAHTDIHASWAPADIANAHAYDGDTDSWPDYWPGQVAKEMAAASPGKPQALTEFGVKHADRQGYLIPQWYAAALQAGIPTLYLYALCDDSEIYGIYDASFNAKPGQPAVSGLLKALANKLGPGLKSLGVTVSDRAINSVLIARDDGSFVHLLWRSWPDGQMHPFTWSYDRPMRVRAIQYAHSAANWAWDNFNWTKSAGQPSDWNTYVDGVLVLEVTNAS